MIQNQSIFFLILGMLGVLLHMLVSIGKLKKAGKFISFIQYFEAEWTSILISVIVVIVAIMCKHYVQKLEAAGDWLAPAYLFMGYAGQSILIYFIGQAEKKLGISADEQEKAQDKADWHNS